MIPDTPALLLAVIEKYTVTEIADGKSNLTKTNRGSNVIKQYKLVIQNLN